MNAIQQTLDGQQTEVARKRPSTLLWCDECEDVVLRSDRWDHDHDLGEEMQAYEKAKAAKLDEKIPDEAVTETQTWEISFHYTCVETVRVEAEHKHEAKEAAELERNYDGKYMETVHTERRTVSDPSAPSMEWLELHELLPEDHDIGRENIERLLDAKAEGQI
jgi:hypothetical protein